MYYFKKIHFRATTQLINEKLEKYKNKIRILVHIKFIGTSLIKIFFQMRNLSILFVKLSFNIYQKGN